MDRPADERKLSFPPEDGPAADVKAADQPAALDMELYADAARKIADKHAEAFRELAD